MLNKQETIRLKAIVYAKKNLSEDIVQRMLEEDFSPLIIKYMNKGDDFGNAINKCISNRLGKRPKHEFKGLHGESYKTGEKMCQAYGTTYSAYHVRIRRGWTHKQALLGSRKIAI